MISHTIFLRTRNRAAALMKVLSLYNDFEYTGTILIADDSSEEQFAVINSFINANNFTFSITHQQGSYRNHQDRTTRVRECHAEFLPKINTDYFSLSSDDDFLFPSFVSTAIQSLESNEFSDAIAIGGVELKLSFSSHLTADALLKPKFWSAIADDDPISRVEHYLAAGSLAFYGVVRRSLIDGLNEASANFGRTALSRQDNSSLPYFDEEFPLILALHLCGKFEVLDNAIQGIRLDDLTDLDRVEVQAREGLIARDVFFKNLCENESCGKSICYLVEELVFATETVTERQLSEEDVSRLWLAIWELIRRWPVDRRRSRSRSLSSLVHGSIDALFARYAEFRNKRLLSRLDLEEYQRYLKISLKN